MKPLCPRDSWPEYPEIRFWLVTAMNITAVSATTYSCETENKNGAASVAATPGKSQISVDDRDFATLSFPGEAGVLSQPGDAGLIFGSIAFFSLRPNNPCGRTRRTMSIETKATVFVSPSVR